MSRRRFRSLSPRRRFHSPRDRLHLVVPRLSPVPRGSAGPLITTKRIPATSLVVAKAVVVVLAAVPPPTPVYIVVLVRDPGSLSLRQLRHNAQPPLHLLLSPPRR